MEYSGVRLLPGGTRILPQPNSVLSQALFRCGEKNVSDLFSIWTVRIVLGGLFVIFVVHFGKFVWSEVWPIIRPLFRR